ncbi:MAG: restriction endonuclease [Gammaproteobacteria bacterium]|nr:restriction endonuclease [Gammaproteobacteria bacterium]
MESNDIPKFNETFIPILEVLRDGAIVSAADLYDEVERKYYSALTQEQKEQTTKSGDRLIRNRIAWGKSYLKKGGYVHFPSRGFVQITDKGKLVKSDQLTLQSISADAITFYQPEADKQPLKVINNEATPQDMIDDGIGRIEREVKDELLAKLKEIDPYSFERIILVLLKRMGYGDFIETAKSGDGGIDGIINQDQLGLDKIYIQAKRYRDNKVREPEIRNFIGAMSGDTQRGIFVTTSTFDEKAKQKVRAAHHKIILLDGSSLADLMFKFNVGVQVQQKYEVKQLDNDFFDAEQI